MLSKYIQNTFLKFIKENVKVIISVFVFFMSIIISITMVYNELNVKPYNVKYFSDYDDNIKNFENNLSKLKKLELEKEREVEYFKKYNSVKDKNYYDRLKKFEDLLYEKASIYVKVSVNRDDILLYEKYFSIADKYKFKKDDTDYLEYQEKTHLTERESLIGHINGKIFFKK